MKITTLITTMLVTLFATSSFSSTTKCDHRGNAGLFANTNPSALKNTDKTKQTSSTTTTRSGVR